MGIYCRSWENITYRRECHANPCKNPNEDFCTDDPYHPGHHICVTCCTTGLCNNRQVFIYIFLTIISLSCTGLSNNRQIILFSTYRFIDHRYYRHSTFLDWKNENQNERILSLKHQTNS